MAAMNEEIRNRWTAEANTSRRAAGATLAVGSLLLVVGLAFHPPPAPTAGEQMATVAGAPAQWMAVHWASAAALSLFAVAGLVVLAGRTRLTERWWTTAAWAVVVVGALWTTTTAVAEATVITQAATAGDAATFEAWEAFAEGLATGVAFLALAVAAIAGNEARTARAATPAWAAWVAVVAGIVSFLGFVAGMWLGIALGGVVWVASSVVVGLWTLWFGVALLRLVDAEPTRPGGAPV